MSRTTSGAKDAMETLGEKFNTLKENIIEEANETSQNLFNARESALQIQTTAQSNVKELAPALVDLQNLTEYLGVDAKTFIQTEHSKQEATMSGQLYNLDT